MEEKGGDGSSEGNSNSNNHIISVLGTPGAMSFVVFIIQSEIKHSVDVLKRSRDRDRDRDIDIDTYKRGSIRTIEARDQ